MRFSERDYMDDDFQDFMHLEGLTSHQRTLLAEDEIRRDRGGEECGFEGETPYGFPSRVKSRKQAHRFRR